MYGYQYFGGNQISNLFFKQNFPIWTTIFLYMYILTLKSMFYVKNDYMNFEFSIIL